MKGKKGQIDSLVGIVGTLLVVGLLIGTGLVVIQEFRDQDSLSDTDGTVTNESELTEGSATVYLNSTDNYTVSESSAYSFHNFAVVEIWNNTCPICGDTDGGYNFSLSSGNWTEYADGHVIAASGAIGNFSNVSISYTYQYGEESWRGVNSSLEAMTTVPDLLGLIILVVMVGVILGIVFNVIPTGGRVGGA